jgi:hypothetical protein
VFVSISFIDFKKIKYLQELFSINFKGCGTLLHDMENIILFLCCAGGRTLL